MERTHTITAADSLIDAQMMQVLTERKNALLVDEVIHQRYQAMAPDEAEEWLFNVAICTLCVPVAERGTSPGFQPNDQIPPGQV